jgi:DNA invertase Pin-like site-specific DNA recombinase
MKVALYARVSTEGQDPEVQLVALRAHAAQRGWQVVEEFVDRGVSGATERRPALDRLMKAAWAGHFQVVLVWRFDRFARSVKHLVAALETFRSLQVGFVSLQEQLDTSTPIGQAMGGKPPRYLEPGEIVRLLGTPSSPCRPSAATPRA